jgi:hypothetical protein
MTFLPGVVIENGDLALPPRAIGVGSPIADPELYKK